MQLHSDRHLLLAYKLQQQLYEKIKLKTKHNKRMLMVA